MELLINVTDSAGRLIGTAGRQGCDTTVVFSGALELLACIERLCRDESAWQATVSTSTNQDL